MTTAPPPGPTLRLGGLELHLAAPLVSQERTYPFQGRLAGSGAELFCDGGSLHIRSTTTGLVEEAFFDAGGAFTQLLELQPQSDNPFLLALCDGLGDEVATVPFAVRHVSGAEAAAGAAAGPTLPHTLAVEVLARARQRHRQPLAPAGSALPGRFSCTCRTTDQAGRVVVPLWQDDRLVHQLVVTELDPHLPIGVPVDVELQVEADQAMTLRVVVRQAGRSESVQLAAPAPPRRPAAEDTARVVQRITALLPEFSGGFGATLQERLRSRQEVLQAALAAGEDSAAAAAQAELDDQLEQMELARLQVQYPPLQRLTQLVKRCLFEASNLADRTGRDRDQLFNQIYAQEQAAEQAHAEKNAAAYRECFDNLRALAADLERVQDDMQPMNRRGQGRGPSVHDVLDELKNLQAYLAAVLPAAQLKGRADLAERLQALDGKRDALADRGKRDAPAALREARRLVADVGQVEQELTGGRTRAGADVDGMLEGSA